MTTTELLEELSKVQQERTLEAHHDDIFFKTYADIEALERVIALIKLLNEMKSSDAVTVAELLAACNIQKD